MGKRTQKHGVRIENDQAGCMWGLISMFDIRHGRFTRKLLLDRKRGSRSPAGASTELKMLTYNDEKPQTNEALEETENTDGLKTKVKELMEEEMVNEQGLKNNMNIPSLQQKQSKKNDSKSFDKHGNGMNVAEHSSHQDPNQEKPNNLDLEVMLEELCRLTEGSDLRHDCHNDVGSCLNQVHSLVEEKIGAAIKVFINQKFSDNGRLANDGKTTDSTEFIDALETLGANKELFFELLHDRSSSLVKHIQCVEDGHLTKEQNTSSLLESNLLKEPTKQRSEKLANQKHRSFFRKRSKSQDSNSLNDKSQPSSRIVILKPGSTTISGNKSAVSKSMESSRTMDDLSQNERNASHFSFTEIRRKLKHVMRKERHGISHNKNYEKGDVEVNGGGWSSPNRNHFYTERFAKSPLSIKREDKIDKPKESETALVNELGEDSKQGVSNIYSEARKHLSELLSSGHRKEELVSKQLPKPLGRILSLPDYSSTHVSPRKDGEQSFVTEQMGLSPCRQFHMAQENMPPIIEENHVHVPCPSKQCSECDSCISVEEPNEDVLSCNSNPDILGELSHDKIVEGTMSSTQEGRSCEELLESVKTNPADEEDIQIVDVTCEPSTSLFMGEIEIHGAVEISDVVESPKHVRLNSHEVDVLLCSPPLSPPNPSVTLKIDNCDTCIDRAARPSPISILEPLFSDDDISPASSKQVPVAKVIEPLCIHFEERDASDFNQAVCIRTSMEDEESAFEYVEAVLLGSGLNWDEYLLRWLSSDQILDPSLFDEVELFSSRSDDQKLLFDCTDKVLKETCERYFSRSYVKQGIRPVPKGMKLINEIWKEVERQILQHPAPHSLDQLVRKDISELRKWMDLYFETDHIVFELEKSILVEIVEEITLSLDVRSMDDKFTVITNESFEDEANVIITNESFEDEANVIIS